MPTYVISAADWSVPERRPKPGSTIKITPDTSFKIVLNGVVAALLQAWDFRQDIWTTSFDGNLFPAMLELELVGRLRFIFCPKGPGRNREAKRNPKLSSYKHDHAEKITTEALSPGA